MNKKEAELFDLVHGLLSLFDGNKLNITQLTCELLKLNPHEPDSMEYKFYMAWIFDNIKDYNDGEHYLLSLESSGSILNGLIDE